MNTRSLRQSMASLHSWTGLLPGWLLFVIFLFGTVSFFQEEVGEWMHPELHHAPLSAKALGNADRLLHLRAADAESWAVTFPGERSSDPLIVSWVPEGATWRDRQEIPLDPSSGRKIVIRDSAGGHFLYRMHFDLHYMPVAWARLIVCTAALAMLVAILSGIVTHKKIFTDFFLLRFGKGQRSWLDGHNVTAVLALPFHLMITYTGLVTLLFTLMPWAISANFKNEASFYAMAMPPPEIRDAEAAMPPLPLSHLVARAETAWDGLKVRYLSIDKPGAEGSVARILPHANSLGGERQAVYLEAATGKTLGPPSSPRWAQATQQTMIDVHAGRFSAPVLRWLYFLSGVGGTVMVASGLVLWTVKRRSKLLDPTRPHFGFHLVERLNIGVIVGAPVGIAVYFLANRLLPLDMANRADWEINSLFIAWGGVFVRTLARPARRAWIEALATSAALYGLVPIVSAFTTARGLISSLIARNGVFVGFDLTMLATATAFAFATRAVARHRRKAASRRTARELKKAAP